MKTIQKVNLGFQHYNDEDIAVQAETIIAAMTNNAHFEEPTPSLQELEDVKEAYLEKLVLSRKKGSPYDTAQKNKARKDLEKVLSELGFYVNKISNGDLPKMLSTGFVLSRYRTKVLPPEQIKNISLKDGLNNGQIMLSFEKVPRAVLYEYRYSKEKDEFGEIQWGPIGYTFKSQNNLIDSVSPGAKYYISVRAKNNRGLSDWSEPVSWYAR